ncbi:UTP--glucose-1-phosphate uridylyltransferase [Candidatus Profftia lariciata]|uniref:sugar phosphate nucleotidyltransferase n=1 Tax=Candidatus Profftia lariciata TaxID=1987921 RepID=UPI001D00F350|nr:sugar phosphate nucleotidyltransferase [Candidatus Profftia lariciata]UDG81510.1 UTP--glucose-1-phosphate uridylyltransferase [Candidatus Profftia lariciata]
MSTVNRTIKTAIIPVAGRGTRMLPATKAIPKEMLPLVDQPMIQYVVNECIVAGIHKIILVTHFSKNSIENYFDTSFESEDFLKMRIKHQILYKAQSLFPKNLTIIPIRQGPERGLGHAILCAYPLIDYEPFIVILPDVILDFNATDINKDNLSDMLSRYRETGYSQIMVKPVPIEEVFNYGIVDCSNVALKEGQSTPIKTVIEKPLINQTPSNMSIVGRYVLSPTIWDVLPKTPIGIGKEMQLTDAIGLLMKQETVEAYYLKGFSHDCGDKMGYMKAFVKYSMCHTSLGKEFTAWLKSLDCFN